VNRNEEHFDNVAKPAIAATDRRGIPGRKYPIPTDSPQALLLIIEIVPTCEINPRRHATPSKISLRFLFGRILEYTRANSPITFSNRNIGAVILKNNLISRDNFEFSSTSCDPLLVRIRAHKSELTPTAGIGGCS
jgi:hypothetical protein